MTVTVNVNGLSLVHRGSGGVSSATLPDVCKTPPNGAPIPYANVARSTSLANGSVTVTADGGNAIALAGSRFASSTGGEAGSLGGVVSGMTGGPASFLSHSFDVRVEGRGPARLTDKMLHNAGNTIDCGGVLQAPVRVARSRGTASASIRAGRCKLTVLVQSDHPHVDGATVVIRGPGRGKGSRQKKTRSDGVVSFAKIPSGRYHVTVTHPCHTTASVRAPSVPTASTAVVTVTLQTPVLKDVAHTKGVAIYGRPNGPELEPASGGGTSIMPREFHGGVLGFFWNSRENPKGVYSWTGPQQTAAALSGMPMMGTPLVWPTGVARPPRYQDAHGHWRTGRELKGNTPYWANYLGRSEVVPHLDQFITTAMSTFRGVVTSWVVANETVNLLFSESVRAQPVWKHYGLWEPAFDPRHPNRRPACWHNILHAFEVAHAADPNALLILNDYDNECWDGRHRPASDAQLRALRHASGGHDNATATGHTLRMIRAEQFHHLADFMRRHLPRVVREKFAVGYQMHWPSAAYRVDLLRENVRRYHEMGLRVVVTEIDVTMEGKPNAWSLFSAAKHGIDPTDPAFLAHDQQFIRDRRRAFEAMYAEQARLYEEIFSALLASPNVDLIATWGVDDAQNQFRPYGYWFESAGITCASPYGGYARKPAYFAICNALAKARARR